MAKITLKNGSEIASITSTETITNRGKRSELMSFYCDGCDCVHVDYPIKDIYSTESEMYMMCKESAEKLHRED